MNIRTTDLRRVATEFLWRRSLLREIQYPSRENALKSISYLIAAMPLALVVWPLAIVRSMYKSFSLHILVAESDFGHLVELLEFARSKLANLPKGSLVVIQYRYRHTALVGLYRPVIASKIVWSSRVAGLLVQAMMLLPSKLIPRYRYTINQVDSTSIPSEPLKPSEELKVLNDKTVRALKLNSSRLVLLTVHTREYDDARTPGSREKDRVLVSVGEELSEAIDFLKSGNTEVIRLGGRDSGVSHIPREMHRLENFGRLGGPHEVALASGCTYFWADEDGGWWLAAPFRKPVLITNKARLEMPKGRNFGPHLTVPVRFCETSGRELTFREILTLRTHGSSPYKLAAKGELKLVRNSPSEIIGAHQELLQRIEGTWKSDAIHERLRIRISSIWSDFPHLGVPDIAASFLTSHQQLLD